MFQKVKFSAKILILTILATSACNPLVASRFVPRGGSMFRSDKGSKGSGSHDSFRSGGRDRSQSMTERGARGRSAKQHAGKPRHAQTLSTRRNRPHRKFQRRPGLLFIASGGSMFQEPNKRHQRKRYRHPYGNYHGKRDYHYYTDTVYGYPVASYGTPAPSYETYTDFSGYNWWKIKNDTSYTTDVRTPTDQTILYPGQSAEIDHSSGWFLDIVPHSSQLSALKLTPQDTILKSHILTIKVNTYGKLELNGSNE